MVGSLRPCLTRGARTKVGEVTFLGTCWVFSIYFVYLFASKQNDNGNAYHTVIEKKEVFLNRTDSNSPAEHSCREEINHSYDKDMPLIFIGGMPRSGTTLMRTMLDAHPDVRCGQETHVVPKILLMRHELLTTPILNNRLKDAGISDEVLNDAVAQFILEIIVKHGKPAKRFCNKDPMILTNTRYLKELFPNSKFILMIRDGRATAHSIISRRVYITGYDVTSYRDVLGKWNRVVEIMFNQCLKVGPEVCLMVYYEQLVLQPIIQSKRILNFLDIPWNDAVLNHEKHISNISLSKTEKSTDQVQRPLYLDALTSWFGHIPADVVRDLPRIAPMLARLGYDPTNPKPKYGEPDEWVLRKAHLEALRM